MKSFQRLLGLIILVGMFISIKPAQAQTTVELNLSSTYEFGEHITFIAQTISPLQIQSASIFIYDATLAIQRTLPVTFDQNGVSVYRFDTQQNLLRPFTTVLWHYELTLADGSTVQSQTQSIRYDDDRFDWQVQELNGLRIHWYNGDADFGLSALNAAQAGLQSIAGFFTPDLSNPVDVFIYANENDLRGTLYGSGEAWAAGHADSAAGQVMVTIEAGADQNILMEQRIPHELMHVMLYRQVGDGYKNIPAWLREGMSVLAEVYPNPEYDRFLVDAASRDALIPVLDLCDSFSPQVDSAFLAYAESRSFTDYLRGQYGTDGLLTLANAYANGVDCKHGTERAFGVSLAQLERDWRVTSLEQNNFMSTLGNFAPYLGLLCLVMIVPLISIVNAMRKKNKD
ncbi:MAG TPA: peptidase MA family metallohydrolase [Anaerolineales bacterium]|nr:peptidase MA family metallohydrolase [Anaerolineales bacterium]